MKRSGPASALVAAAVILCLLATPLVPGGWLTWLAVVPALLAVAAASGCVRGRP